MKSNIFTMGLIVTDVSHNRNIRESKRETHMYVKKMFIHCKKTKTSDTDVEIKNTMFIKFSKKLIAGDQYRKWNILKKKTLKISELVYLSPSSYETIRLLTFER